MLCSRVISFVCVAVLAGSLTAGTGTRGRGAASPQTEIVTHDNVRPAGELRAGVLTIDLVAGRGNWYPEGAAGPVHDVYAFGEAGKPLSNPGPLLRVPAGTEVRATIRNTIADEPLVVHGLHDRPGTPSPVTVPAGGTTSVSFRLTSPGTYLYWGTTRGARALRDRFGQESQLLGVLIVDAPGAVPADHVFVLGIEDEAGPIPADRPLRAAVINGRSWPHSAITTVHVGDTVRMRWVNATDRVHPMHLHGFYFRVDARGDIARDTIYDTEQQRLAVTELLPQGSTMAIQWVPERAGNWLMHCHMTLHVAPELRRGAKHVAHDALRNHTLEVMAGLVTGWRVLARSADRAPDTAVNHRKLRLLVQAAPRRYAGEPGLGFVLQEGDAAPRADSVVIPGPPLVLVRGEPVEIAVVNRMREPTSIHWHGIERCHVRSSSGPALGAEQTGTGRDCAGNAERLDDASHRAGSAAHVSHTTDQHQSKPAARAVDRRRFRPGALARRRQGWRDTAGRTGAPGSSRRPDGGGRGV
jgi:FtsP/CotA-like multicopper oxidase with cupredoxin domain